MMDFFKICTLPFRILSSIFEPSTNNARADSLIDSTPGLHSSLLHLPPVRFHSTHGSNIILQKNRTVARRHENFCKGLTFSNRPIVVDEKIYVKLIDTSDNWGGVIRFGYTSHDPITLENRLPKYACPDLTNQSGFWAKAVEERLADKDATLYFYVNRYGTVFYGIEGRPKNEFFNGVDVSGPLWAIIDVYGNSTAVELIDVRLNNSSAAHQNVGYDFCDSNDAGCSDTVDTELANSFSTLSCHSYSDGTRVGFDQQLTVVPISSNIGVEFSEDASEASGYILCPLSAQRDLDSKYFDLRLTPLPFHAKYGLNVRLSSSRLIASRLETEYSLGYVFTPRPIGPNEFIVIEVLKTDSVYLSGLAFGVTSENPGLIDVVDLPEDADELINRTNTFIVSKNVANTPCEGDILIFSMTETGEVRMKKNCEDDVLLFYVEKNVPYWWFFDVYGSTIEIRAFSGILDSLEPVSSTSPVRQELMTSSSTSSSEVVVAPAAPIAASSEYPENSGDSVPTSSNGAGGYAPSHPVIGNSQPVLIVKCYSDGAEPINIVLQSQTTCHRDAAQGSQPVVGSHVPSSATTNASVYTVRGNLSDDSTCENGRNREYRLREWAKSNWRQQPGGHRPNECSVCFERPVDAVLYTCGHMCLCYDCAHELWRGSRGDGHCPICRAIIKDVIRTYKS